MQTALRRRDTLILFLLGLLVSAVAALPQSTPGYMDAEYYYAGAIRLHEGHGWMQPFLWNYLDDPAGLPHPSHTYWMPLASLVAATGMLMAGSSDFLSARLIFILLAALLPPLTAWLAYRLSGRRRTGILAGLLAAFPGYYLAYTTLTENFTLYMLLGTLFLGTAFLLPFRSLNLRFAALGVLAGLMHLTRADGILWLLAALVVALAWRFERLNRWRSGLRLGLLVLAAYVVVMAPWFARNLQLDGALFPPGGSRALWITDYDQTYHYPASELTPQHWLSRGWQGHLQSRLQALGMNLQTTLAVQGSIILLPLVLLGVWQLRKEPALHLGAGMWLVTLAVMTVVFPFAGWRGGFLHSGAALQPLWWAAAAIGFERFIAWGVQRRNWNETSYRVFSTALVVLVIVLSAVLYYQKVAGADLRNPAWNAGYARFQDLDAGLVTLGVAADDLVMVNNPPGLYTATRRSSIVVPDGTPETAVAAGRRYGAAYLLLDENYTQGLAALYHQPGDQPGLTYLDTAAGTRVYRIEYD